MADREATMELLQLRRRVDELQSELAKARTSAPKGAEGLAQGDDPHTLRFSFQARAPGEYSSSNWAGSFSPTWDELFAVAAPLMINEAAEKTIKAALDAFIEDRNLARLNEHEKLTRHSLHSFSLHQEDFQTVKVQFRALGLIAKNEKARSVKDSGTYWTLTPYGDEVMTRLRAIRSNQAEEMSDEDITPGDE